MATFSITDDNNIMFFASAEEAVQGESNALAFDSEAGLSELSAAWPMSRFVDIYNGIAGHGEIKKFANRKQAVARIWSAIQPLASRAGTEPAPSEAAQGTRTRRSKRAKSGGAKKTPAKRSPKDVRRGSKKAAVIAMMKRAQGVTLATIMRATGWQAHTVRGFVSILGSQGGHKIESLKNAAGERIYHITK
jgi:Protein of unknown function (DUF3489)